MTSKTTEEPDGGIFARQRAAEQQGIVSAKVVGTDMGLRLEILKLAAQHDLIGTPTSTVAAATAYLEWMNK